MSFLAVCPFLGGRPQKQHHAIKLSVKCPAIHLSTTCGWVCQPDMMSVSILHNYEVIPANVRNTRERYLGEKIESDLSV